VAVLHDFTAQGKQMNKIAPSKIIRNLRVIMTLAIRFTASAKSSQGFSSRGYDQAHWQRITNFHDARHAPVCRGLPRAMRDTNENYFL